MRHLLVLSVLSLAACATPGHQDPATLAQPDGGALGSDPMSARVILRNNCGTCHRGDLPEHKPAAVEIFDLSEEESWSRKMTDEQLRKAIGRLSASEREEALFGEFVTAELQRRSAGASALPASRQ
jgi:hypothetical protein